MANIHTSHNKQINFPPTGENKPITGNLLNQQDNSRLLGLLDQIAGAIAPARPRLSTFSLLCCVAPGIALAFIAHQNKKRWLQTLPVYKHLRPLGAVEKL